MNELMKPRIKVWLYATAIMILVAAGSCDSPIAPEPAGWLEGKVTIGPICPVEIEGVPCPVPPEAYAARKVMVYNSSRSRLIATVEIDSQGNYRVALDPGSYVVDINRIGIDSSSDVPASVRIASGETFRLNISIDTGIR